MSDDKWDTVTERRGKGGFVVRYELLAIIGLMMVQLCGAIWWASAISRDVTHMAKSFEVFATSSANAATVVSARFDKLHEVVLVHENRLTRLESKQ